MKVNGKRYVLRLKRNKKNIRLVTVFMFLAVVCLPFHTLTIGGVGILMLIGIPLLVLSMPALLAQLRKKTWDPAMLLLIGFFAYNILAYLWTPTFSAYSLYNYIKIVVIVMCMYCQQYNEQEKKLLLSGSVLSGLIVCWFILTGRNVGYLDGRVIIAVFGVKQDPNYIGYIFLVPMAVSIDQFIRGKTVCNRIIFVLLGLLILFCVMMTGSRGALLGIAVVAIVCMVTRFKKLLSKAIFCVAMSVCVMLVYRFVISLLPEYIAERFSLQLLIQTGGTGRMDIWMNAFRVMASQPYKLISGFGTGSSHYLLDGWAAHNFIIQLLLEQGIVGAGLFLSFLWLWIRRLAGQDGMCLGILMGCMAMAMTLSVNTIYYFWVVFILGIVCSKSMTPTSGGSYQT